MNIARHATRVFLLGGVGALLGGATAPGTSKDWYRITVADGSVIGAASHEISRDGAGTTITDVQDISLIESHHGAMALHQQRVERRDATGHTLSIIDKSRSGDATTETSMQIAGDVARITRRTGAGERHVTIPLPPGVRLDDGDGLLNDWDMARDRVLAFDQLDIGSMAIEHVVLERVSGVQHEAGGSIAVMRRHYDGDQLRAVARLLLDERHQIIAVTHPMFGTRITLHATDRNIAQQPHPPLRIDLEMAVASPFHISIVAMRGHIRYRFRFADGMRFLPPQTGEQRVTMTEEGATVDVCNDCGPGLASDAAALSAARQPTTWLQSDNAVLRDLAAPVVGMNVSDGRKMALLATRARRRLSKLDPWGHYSALDALKRGAGDCTEDAVVLAALGRAVGIPTKVVNGLAYVRGEFHGERNAFLPHSWTIAWVDGAWRSFDMSLDGFDATHIALTVGDGDARSVLAVGALASLLVWQDMAEVRAAP
ncbi:transglutaminase-like domain-containing protein [Sphingomonas sp. RT2P30]|uniref:transglutaminase-like domain-containing protein n=1 Tax=Parasphingomonas halimpatiens TaxID=3096162 RepID=UPI002FCB7496